ncbi:2-methylaconitate cis-trans isomerase PrpF family protein [Sporomusa sp.]|uniref:2-methylaconitate cis-trans isomerase PrpF family protein n=1 Tax=Sporomusa sp. TaxID=2078658 RepID=UPI002C12A668|nr:PrpF domain-containing protein [Sporomusa sp.]HWR08788.1 PrpF domain-containing protein [Sporomusa sp.]
MSEQEMFRCTIMRGGTSKAVFLRYNDLPLEKELRDRIILGIYGSPDVGQIDGLGGARVQTSKLAIISPPSRSDADVDYTFGQVQLDSAKIDYSINCGNISSAVGPFAIDEGMVAAKEPVTEVRIHNTNTQKILIAKVPVKDGRAVVEGDFKVDTVPGTGARIELDFSRTVGAATGKLLPTGNVLDVINVEGLGKVPVSMVDCANLMLFVNSKVLGLTGKESTPEIAANREIMNSVESIRATAAVEFGIVPRGQNATKVSPVRPIIALVSEAADYIDYVTKEVWSAEKFDFLARPFFNQHTGDAFPGTGTICASVAAMLEGTIVNQVVSQKAKDTGVVRLGYPRGVNEVEVKISRNKDGFVVEHAQICRTARRILDGYVYVKKSLIQI